MKKLGRITITHYSHSLHGKWTRVRMWSRVNLVVHPLRHEAFRQELLSSPIYTPLYIVGLHVDHMYKTPVSKLTGKKITPSG